MKGKNLSKVLAFLLAAVMIFSALPLMAFASDEAATYTVSYAAPAIPMDVNTKVDLKTLAVEMAAGTTVSGAECDWATEETDGIVLDATKKTVEALAAGNYKLTATANGVTKNVWVIVRAEGETEFYLVNIPKVNPSTFVFDEWRKFAQKNTAVTEVTKFYSSTNDYVQFEFGTGYVYVDEIFDDFADYTVAAYMASQSSAVNASCGAGTIGRLRIEDSKTAGGIVSYVRLNGQIGVRKPSNVSSYGYCGTATLSYTSNPADNFWGAFAAKHEIVTIHSGSVTKFYADGKLFLDTSVNSTNYEPVNETAAGYPGVMSYGSNAYLMSFAVKLNSNEMPAVMTEEEPAPEADITIVGEGTAAVEAVVGSENNYTVELAPAEGYKVKVGSLVIDGKAVILGAEGDTTGRLYTFKSDNLNATTISVEYIPDDGTFNSMMLGATIPVNPEKKGIRFGARTDFIRRNGETGFLGDKVLVDGVVYEPTEVGMLFIPSALIDGELTVNTERATRQAVSKVVKLTGDFSDIAITLVGIPESFFGVKISSRMYVAYEVDGETKYVYTEVIERSYNDVVAAIGK